MPGPKDTDYQDIKYITSTEDGKGIQLNIESDEVSYSDKDYPKTALVLEEKTFKNKKAVIEAMQEMKLFGEEGPEAKDVLQEKNGACYFMSILRNLAAFNPDVIKKMVTQEYTVSGGKKTPTGYAIVHFFAENKQGIKVPYDVRVPMTYTSVEGFREGKDLTNPYKKPEVRWSIVIQKAYLMSMLWKTGGKLPEKEQFENSLGKGNGPVISYWNVVCGTPKFYEGSDPAVFVNNIFPEKMNDNMAGKTYSDMISSGSMEAAVEVMSNALKKAKENKDIMILSVKNMHAISVEKIEEKEGKVYVTWFDQLNRIGGSHSVEHLLKEKRPNITAIHIYNKNDLSVQRIPLKTLETAFEKIGADAQMKLFMDAFRKEIKLSDKLYNDEHKMEYILTDSHLKAHIEDLQKRLMEEKLIDNASTKGAFEKRFNAVKNYMLKIAGEYYEKKAEENIKQFPAMPAVKTFFTDYLGTLKEESLKKEEKIAKALPSKQSIDEMSRRNEDKFNRNIEAWMKSLKADEKVLNDSFAALEENTFRDSRKFEAMQELLEKTWRCSKDLIEQLEKISEKSTSAEMKEFVEKNDEYQKSMKKLFKATDTYVDYKKDNVKSGIFRTGLGKHRLDEARKLLANVQKIGNEQLKRKTDIVNGMKEFFDVNKVVAFERSIADQIPTENDNMGQEEKDRYKNRAFNALRKGFTPEEYGRLRAMIKLENPNGDAVYKKNDLDRKALQISQDPVCLAMRELYRGKKVTSVEELGNVEGIANKLVEDLKRYESMNEKELVRERNELENPLNKDIVGDMVAGFSDRAISARKNRINSVLEQINAYKGKDQVIEEPEMRMLL